MENGLRERENEMAKLLHRQKKSLRKKKKRREV